MDKSVVPFDWARMLLGDPPPGFLLEIVVRVILIYAFALLMMQLMGKRGRNQMNPLEYLIIIALGSATGDVMFYPEVPLTYAALVIATVMLMGALMATLETRSERLRKLFEWTPTILVEDGELIPANLRRERVSEGELFSELREGGVEQLGQVRLAILELSGRISIFKFSDEKVRAGQNILPPSVVKSPQPVTSANPLRADR